MGTSLSVAFVMNTHWDAKFTTLFDILHAYILYRHRVQVRVYINTQHILVYRIKSFHYVSNDFMHTKNSINRFSSSVSDFPLSSYIYIHMNMYIYIPYVSCICLYSCMTWRLFFSKLLRINTFSRCAHYLMISPRT